MSEVCCAQIKVGTGWQSYKKPCGKPAKVTVDGRHYCGVHNPVTKKARSDQRRAEKQANWEQARKVCRIEAAAPQLLEALQELVQKRLEKASSPAEADGSDGRYARARAAIAKATGEQP